VNTNGLLTVTARDRETGSNADIKLQHDRQRLSGEEIDRMCAEVGHCRMIRPLLPGLFVVRDLNLWSRPNHQNEIDFGLDHQTLPHLNRFEVLVQVRLTDQALTTC
jgi:hypothetical protein